MSGRAKPTALTVALPLMNAAPVLCVASRLTVMVLDIQWSLQFSATDSALPSMVLPALSSCVTDTSTTTLGFWSFGHKYRIGTFTAAP